jgi:predicted nucleic acid-binding protein
MRCVVDTNVLVDILQGDERHGRDSARRLARVLRSAAVVAPPFVYCELMAAGRGAERLTEFFRRSRVVLEPQVPLAVYETAAQRYREYLVARRQGSDEVQCPGCGASQRPVCSNCNQSLSVRKLPFDFLIGAFAIVAGGRRLLTRDAGAYRRFFPDLLLI